MKKKWIAIGMLAVVVTVGSIIGDIEVQAQSCLVEGCEQTMEHKHNHCLVEGCKQTEEHKHNSCGVEDCTKTKKHSHNEKRSHHSGHKNKRHH